MLLAIDVGNTNIVLGVFDGDALVQSWRLQTLRERTSDELGLLVDGLFAHQPDRRACRSTASSSARSCRRSRGTLARWCERYFGLKALTVDPASNTGMPILYENPAEVGADRIVNSIAAYEKYGRGPGPAAHRRSTSARRRRSTP